MNPGPVMVDERVRAALTGPDLCHREPEFSALMTRVRERVVEVCGGTRDEHAAVVLTGSGTSAVEAALSSVVPDDGGVLVVENGHYGERFSELADLYGLRSARVDFGWSQPVDLERVAEALSADPGLTHVAMVHHETSTGMLNDVAAVARVARAAGCATIVDAVSSVGAERLHLADDGLDWVAGSASKCLESVPGLGFVCGRRDGFAALDGVRRRTQYLDLRRHFAAQVEAEAPAFTPAIPAFYAFDVALELALEEGVAARGERYRRLADRLREGVRRLGLTLLLDPAERAASLTAVRLPDGLSLAELHDGLKDAGFVIYAAQGPLSGDFFRLSTMGVMTERHIDGFLDALARVTGRSAAPA